VPLFTALTSSSEDLRRANHATGDHFTEFITAKYKVVPVAAEAPSNNFINEVWPFHTDLDNEIAAYHTAANGNVAVYTEYTKHANEKYGVLPSDFAELAPDDSAVSEVTTPSDSAPGSQWNYNDRLWGTYADAPPSSAPSAIHEPGAAPPFNVALPIGRADSLSNTHDLGRSDWSFSGAQSTQSSGSPRTIATRECSPICSASHVLEVASSTRLIAPLWDAGSAPHRSPISTLSRDVG
jgi:hypothetical protein